MSNKKAVVAIATVFVLIIVLIIFKDGIYRYDQVDKGNYEELIRTNKITGQSYIFTDDGWKTQESILKEQHDVEIGKYNKEIEAIDEKIKSAKQILDNLDEYAESIKFYNTGHDYYENPNNNKSYTNKRIYAFEWDDKADYQILEIIGMEDIGSYVKNGFTFEDAIKDKIKNYKKEIANIQSKINDIK